MASLHGWRGGSRFGTLFGPGAFHKMPGHKMPSHKMPDHKMTPRARKPDFFIVGAPKAGTTAMCHYLGQHPEVFMLYRKEVHFFGSDLTKIPHEIFVLDEKRYLSYFAEAGDALRLGESSVMYLYSRTAAREIRAFNPDARIVVMLRNPADLLYAYHSQLYWGGYENIADFEGALAAEADRRAGRRVPRGAMMPNALYYRDVARIGEQVERYLEVFGRDKVHIDIFDDFKKDPRESYLKVVDFLGVSRREPESYKVVNPNKAPRVRIFQELVHRPPFPGGLIMRALPDKLSYWLHGKLVRINTTFDRRPPLDPDLRASLLSEFAPDIERLSALLDRDMTPWIAGRELAS